MIKILKYTIYDLLRSWWTYGNFLFYLLTASVLLSFSADISRSIASLMNLIIVLNPLVAMILGTIFYYNSRDFIELLAAQPLKRKSIFLGQYLGLSSSLALSYALGIGIPFIIFGSQQDGYSGSMLSLFISGVLLTYIFTAIAFLIAIKNENKVKGFGIAMVAWLFFAIIYDGLFLLTIVFFEDYPLEGISLGLVFLNPIDLARILMLLSLDISALMGYTGAVFQKVFTQNLGIILIAVSGLIWISVPVYGFVRAGNKKDF